MKLSVGTNWDEKFIDEVASNSDVYEVYGSANSTPIGTGRPSFILGKISKEEMPKYIKKLHDKGLIFNYTLNAPCLNNQEFNKEAHMALIEQLKWLVDSGIDGVTVSIPYLLELIKKHFPTLHAKVSIIAQVNTVQKAKFFEELGADEIMLDYMINRDFELLDNIKKSVKSKLSLLLNDCCIYGCPYRNYHYNICGHASQTNHATKGFYIDYCAVKCTLERLRDPNLLVSSRWIRPEDVKVYEEMGFENFKISGRRMATKWIANTVKAYSDRSYNGNLSNILDYSILGMENDVHSLEYETMLGGAALLNSDSFMQLGQFYPKRPYIENKAFDDGFIDFFKNNHCTGVCAECHYCENYAKKAVKLDQDEVANQVNIYQELIDDLTTSRMFMDVKEEEQQMEQDKELIWNEKIAKDFDRVMSFAPDELRKFAREVIVKAITENVNKRGDNEVTEEDMVNAFLMNTPAFFRNDMITSLKEIGTDLCKYVV